MHRRFAFTLIELLVVVTIIAVLLSLLTPAMDKAVEQAERTRCAAQLHAWSIGIANYSVEHKNRLLCTFREIHVSTLSSVAWGRDDKAAEYSDQWSAQAMLPYVPGSDTVNHY